MLPRILLLSNTVDSVSGRSFWHCKNAIIRFFESVKSREILFIPYAKIDHEAYTRSTEESFQNIIPDIHLSGIHANIHSTTKDAIEKASAIFIGGGNTFRLLKYLHDLDLITAIRKRVLQDGIPYMGSSAGAIVATPSINLTNDMAIVWPKTLDALSLVPFYMNAHYQDSSSVSPMSSTRDDNIKEYMNEARVSAVVGLREGNFIRIEEGKLTLGGDKPLRIFSHTGYKDFPAYADFSKLLASR